MSLFDDVHLEYEKSQATKHFVIEGDPMPRVRFGYEENHMSLANCPDCNSGHGSLHMLGCTVEQCPLCESSAYNCSCSYEKRPNELLR